MEISVLLYLPSNSVSPELWEKYPDLITCIIEWNYPVLPREQETVDNLESFISNEIKIDLSERKIDEFFSEGYFDSEYSKQDIKKISVFEHLSSIKYKIDAIAWEMGEDNKPIPCIYISPKMNKAK